MFARQFIIIIFLSILIVSCSTIENTSLAQDVEVDRNPSSTLEDIQSLVFTNSDFAFDLYHGIIQQESGNVIFSPYSISLTLAILYAGADGETQSSIADVLRYQLSPDKLHSAFGALDMTLQPPLEATPIPSPTPIDTRLNFDPAQDLELVIANALWGQEGLLFEESYLELLASNYGISLQTLDFSDVKSAYQTINEWIIEATNGRIINMPLENAISSATQLFLTNAIYFRGEWTFPFRGADTYQDTFHTLDNKEVLISMMVNDFVELKCGKSEDFHAVELTYGETRNASMLIILPDDGKFQQVEQSLDSEFLEKLKIDIEFTNMLTFKMPRFAIETSIDLMSVFSSLGIELDGNTNFTRISPNSISLDSAEHRAVISVDEQGTEAIGVTNVMMAIMGWLSQCGDEVIASRPFIFIIYDSHTGTILFLGRVMNPLG